MRKAWLFIRSLGLRRMAVVGAVVVLCLTAGGVAGAHRALFAVGAASVSGAPTSSADSPASSATATSVVPSTSGGASPTNLVQVVNQADGHLRVLGRIQFNEIHAASVTPVNDATALGVTCSGCQTLAVAIQVNVLSTSATYVAPANTAVAANGGCNGCTTIAQAFQYNIAVADPTAVPPRVHALVAAMQAALATLPTSASLGDALSRVNAVLAQYQDLTQWLRTASQTATDSNTPNAAGLIPSPSPSASASAAAASPSPSPSPTASPSATTSATTPTPSPSPS